MKAIVLIFALTLSGCGSIAVKPAPEAPLTPQQVQACEGIPKIPGRSMGEVVVAYEGLKGLYKQCSALNDEKIGIIKRATP